MRTNKFFKRILAGILTMSMAAAVSIGASAATTDTGTTGTGNVNGSVEIDGNIIPLTISITHPATVEYTIDANSGTFTADSVNVTNNSKCAVNVAVESLQSTSGGSIEFTDVAPDAEDWNNLNTADTKKYIALGVDIANSTGWNTGYSTSTDWAASDAAVTFGSISSAKTASLSLTAKYGLAWDSTYTAKHEMNFMFSLV